MRVETLSILGVASTAVAQNAPTVKTNNGTLQGVRCSSANVNSFLGIPYAQAPLGRLRFAPPEPFNKTYTLQDATQPPPACVQFYPGFAEAGAQSEDWYAFHV